jgi:membrane protease YdiL (CAAX protease family)
VSDGPVTTPPPAPAPVPAGAEDRRHFLRRYEGLPPNGFNWTTAMIAFFSAMVAGVIGGAIVAAIFDPQLETNASKLAAQAVVVVSFIGAALLVAGIDANDHGGSLLDRFGLRRFGPWMIGIAGLAWLVYFVIQVGIAPLISPEQKDVTEELGTNEDSAVSIIATAILVVPGAAISEELLFRGVIFSGLRKSMSLWPAALISSLVWSLLHLVSGNLAVAGVLAIFGLALAWAYERSGSLWTPICAHAFNNTLAVLALFLT